MDVLSHTHPTQGVLYDKDLTGDLGDRIRTISDLKSSSATTTLRWYYYNGLGERIVKTDGATNHTPFVYDAFGHLVGEYVYSSTSSASYQEHIWLGDTPIANMRNGVTSPLYVLADHLNTPRRVVFPSNNTVVWQWNGEPFGADQATGSGTYNLRFPGQYYDAETGKHYNYFRDYDPAMGRYIESDPIGLAGGMNTYGYVGGSILTRADRRGLSPQDVQNILGEYSNTISWMEKNDHRMSEAPGWVNNLSNLLRPDSRRYVCFDQVECLNCRLSKVATQDKWVYEIIEQPGHYVSRATSSNGSDPSIYFDPWRNSYEVVYPGGKPSTSGTVVYTYDEFDATCKCPDQGSNNLKGLFGE